MWETLGNIPNPLEGYGSEGVTAFVLFFVIRSIGRKLGIWQKMRIKIQIAFGKTGDNPGHNPGNPNSTGGLNKIPGHAQACRKHNDKLIEIEGEIKTMGEGLDEIKDLNRQDHQRMFDKLDRKVDK